MHSIDGAILIIDMGAGFVEATADVTFDSMLLLRPAPEVTSLQVTHLERDVRARPRCAASSGGRTGSVVLTMVRAHRILSTSLCMHRDGPSLLPSTSLWGAGADLRRGPAHPG